MQSCLLLIAPALFAASIYMTLGRIMVLMHGEHHSIIRVNWLTKIFVAGDVLSFLMQSSGASNPSIPPGILIRQRGDLQNFINPPIGAGILVKDQESQEMGENIILAGLFVQIIIFCFFVVCALTFRFRIAKNPTSQSHSLHHVFRKHIYVLYATSVLIVIRSIIRVVEYIQGHHGYILQHEYFLYVFDALPMFFVSVFFNFVHPSEINCLLGRAKKMTKKGGLIVTELQLSV